MTMNMTPPYQMPSRYQQPSYNTKKQYSLNGMVDTRGDNLQYAQNNTRPYPSNSINQYANYPPQFNPNQNNHAIDTNEYLQSQFVNRPPVYESYPQRQNSFMRSPQGPQQRYLSPVGNPGYSPQQSYQATNYQQSYPNNYPPQGPIYQQPVNPNIYQQQPFPNPNVYQQPVPNQNSYQQNFAPNYVPLYTSPYQNYQFMMPNQQRKNIPQQSINSNFSYENANFDCDYSVQQNLVHCVICNQTYKTNQRKQHLQLHREKARNINIRPIDQQQLKRLEKYNSIIKTGLIVKPIVEPDEFNVQYNPNEFVLRKVTQYKDIDAPNKNTIQIQTEDPHNISHSRPQDFGFNDSRRSGNSSPDRRNQSIRRNQNPAVVQNPRNTNTRFNSETFRQEEKIFLSDRFDHHQNEGESFNSNYNPNKSMRESERSNKLGYEESPSLKYRNAESSDHPQDLGYEKTKSLHQIHEAQQEYRQSNNHQIPIEKILNQVQRDSEY